MNFVPTSLFANAGETVRVVIQSLDGYGNRADGYVPIVSQVLFPDLSSAVGYPVEMMRVDTGLYLHGLVLPPGADTLGTYIVSVFFLQPVTGQPIWETFTIQASKPFGTVALTPR